MQMQQLLSDGVYKQLSALVCEKGCGVWERGRTRGEAPVPGAVPSRGFRKAPAVSFSQQG